METIDLITLGCRVNQAESGSLERFLLTRDIAVNHGLSGNKWVVINTCAVTAVAAATAKKQIRRAVRLNPSSKIIVTGCLGALEGSALLKMAGVVAVFGPASWIKVASFILGQEISIATELSPILAVAGYRTRPEIKVQDGCDGKCAYCTIPKARGPSQSAPFEQAVAFIGQIAQKGYKEIALSGIHLGRYGIDLKPATSLAALVRELVIKNRAVRLRLGSLEAIEITDELLNTLSEYEARICPHFHLPLQSGSDSVLERMNRPYKKALFREKVLALKERFPLATIGSDIIIGHPGEDAAAFKETMDFLQNVPLDYMHIFPFSPRPGTPAFNMGDTPPAPVLKERLKEVHAFDFERRKALYARQIGRQLSVIFEQKNGAYLIGTSENYIEVHFKTGADLEPSPFKLHQITAGNYINENGHLFLNAENL